MPSSCRHHPVFIPSSSRLHHVFIPSSRLRPGATVYLTETSSGTTGTNQDGRRDESIKKGAEPGTVRRPSRAHTGTLRLRSPPHHRRPLANLHLLLAGGDHAADTGTSQVGYDRVSHHLRGGKQKKGNAVCSQMVEISTIHNYHSGSSRLTLWKHLSASPKFIVQSCRSIISGLSVKGTPVERRVRKATELRGYSLRWPGYLSIP